MSNYDEMIKHEKQAFKKRRINNYKIQNIKCCSTCLYSNRASIEDSLDCYIINPDNKYSISGITEHGICDKYKTRS